MRRQTSDHHCHGQQRTSVARGTVLPALSSAVALLVLLPPAVTASTSVDVSLSRERQVDTAGTLMTSLHSTGSEARNSKQRQPCLRIGLARPGTFKNEIEQAGRYANQSAAIGFKFRRLPKICVDFRRRVFGMFQAKTPEAKHTDTKEAWRSLTGRLKGIKIFSEEEGVFGVFSRRATPRHKPGNRIYIRPGEIARFVGLIKLFGPKGNQVAKRWFTDRSTVCPAGRGKPECALRAEASR